jgi:gluconolactonase
MVLKQPSGRSNGLAFDKDGNLWLCANNRNEIWKIPGDKKVETIISSFDGKVFTE